MFKLLREFFGLEGNNLLLICGDSGSGKTLFGFEVLKEIGGAGCGIYVSCGIDRSVLFSRYSGLGTYLREVIDASDFPFPQKEDVYESISRSNLPVFLRYLYEKAEEAKNAFIFIDDFENVCNVIDLDPVSTMELYVAFLRHAGLCSVIAVKSEGDLGRVVDGVVVLEKERINGRVIRRGFFKKLCGVKIHDPSFLYTLLGGRFLPLSRSLTDVEGLPGNILSKIHGLALGSSLRAGALGERLVSFGSEDLDRFLGGLTENCFNLIVFDANVPLLVCSLTLLSIASRFIEDGGKVISVGMEPLLRAPFLPSLSLEECGKPYFSLSILGGIDELRSNIRDHLEGGAGPFLLLLNIDYLEAELGRDEVIRLLYYLTTLPAARGCMLGVCLKPSPVIQGLASRVFSFNEKDGYTLACGIKPWTPYYLLTVNLTYDGYVKLSLTELV